MRDWQSGLLLENLAVSFDKIGSGVYLSRCDIVLAKSNPCLAQKRWQPTSRRQLDVMARGDARIRLGRHIPDEASRGTLSAYDTDHLWLAKRLS